MVQRGVLAEVVADPIALAREIQGAAVAVPGVMRISPGRGFLEATYGRGTMVQGVGMGVDDGRFEVSVHVVAGPTPIPALAQRLRGVVGTVVRTHTGRSADAIDLYIDDIVLNVGTRGPGAA